MTLPSSYVGPPAVSLVIPVTLGCDFVFSVRRLDANQQPVDYVGPVVCHVTDDRELINETIPATVTGNMATVRLTPDVLDRVRYSTKWRLAAQDPSFTPTLETPLMVGTFEPHD